MTHRATRPHIMGAAAALVIVSACTPPPAGPTYDEHVARWVGDTEVNLVSAWGLPAGTHALETGGRIVEYTKKQEGSVVCTTRFTIDEAGRIIQYVYRGSGCKAPKGI